jgi:hypothetical protein
MIYAVQNKTDRKLDLFLEHRFVPGWDLVETEKPVEKTEHFHRFRFDVPPKKTLKFVVSEKGDETETHAVQNVSRDQLRVWLESRYIDRKTLETLQGLLELNEKAGALGRRIQEREKEINDIFQNQERLRKHLQALGASQDEKGLRERYVSEMAKEEGRLREHRSEIRKMREEKEKLEEELRSRVGRLRFETTL